EWRGARLPTLAEWERAAAMMPDDVARDQILAWYSRPLKMPLPEVGTTSATTTGVKDLHGLIWEWTEDFDAIAVTSRAGDEDSAAQFFCGGGAIGVVDPSDYAAFLRYAFRGSLAATHSVAGLGFRCAHPLETSL
nr:SUMF1/EgtB/PvdO family nonheme iron enzyme [Kiritimatiellia bacterium]